MPCHVGHIEDRASTRSLDDLLRCIEFARLRGLCDVPSVKQEVRCSGKRNTVNLSDGKLPGTRYVLVGCLVEADVAVADLHEAER